MSEKIFDPRASHEDRRNCERVELDGGAIYVKEMEAADTLFCLDHSVRPAGNSQAASLDVGGLQLWQVVVSCYRGKEADAARVFEITDIPVIRKLRNSDWQKIQKAIEQVNGLAEAEVSAVQDFTGVNAAGSPATLPSGASSNSAVSPVR